MPWQNRLLSAVYESPSGVRISFDYEDVSKAFDKKTAAFNFPDASGTYVQDNGFTGRRYPLRLFFWGDDHDLTANDFEAALQETGAGKLEHPIYGVVTVVPFGTITQRDDLKTSANQSIFEVTFWDTIGLIYPTSQVDPASNVLSAVTDFNDAESTAFSEFISLGSQTEKATFENSYQSLLDTTTSGLQSIADTQSDVEKQFNTVNDSINQGLDVLVGDPLSLAFQTTILIQAPSRALTNIQSRLVGYRNLLNSIIAGDSSISTPGNGSGNSNEFHTKDLFASTYVTGSIVSVVNNQFVTKTDALLAAENILEQFNDVLVWRDDNFKSLDQIDDGSAYQQLQEAVALAAGFLVEISFTLKQERRFTLDRNRTIIDLTGELYGSVDNQLDFFITSNDLSGSEILEIPAGREIVYYI